MLEVNAPRRIIKSIYKSLYPDTETPPPGCTVKVSIINEEKLSLTMECERVSLLRALFNSYFSILSMIMHVYEGFMYESAENPS